MPDKPKVTTLREKYGLGKTQEALRITPLAFWEHWKTVGLMYRNYRDNDPVFERLMGGKLQWPFARFVRGPVYYWLANRGYGLRNGRELAGQMYLQHRKFLMHINDLEVNEGFRGRGYSYKMMQYAEEEARHLGCRFMTLGVTLSNTRAVKLYRKLDYQEQHHRHFFLSRPHVVLPPEHTPVPAGFRSINLRPLKQKEAKANLYRFFEMEQHASNPETAPVWESYYRPHIPDAGQGNSFSVHFMNGPAEGHVDFYDWSTRGIRWRVYLSPERWGKPEEKIVLEMLLHHGRGNTYQWVSIGSEQHHRQVLLQAQQLGLVERNGERMLMIKILD
jgi:ribosomal protein S18 acetylase RimI-like enzyme